MLMNHRSIHASGSFLRILSEAMFKRLEHLYIRTCLHTWCLLCFKGPPKLSMTASVCLACFRISGYGLDSRDGELSGILAQPHFHTPPQAYQFWCDSLRGSSMTYLDFKSLSGSPPSHKRGSLTTSTTEIFHPPAPAGITMATVVRTAWALCLAHMTGTDDIVFGQLVNGRNLELPEAEAVVGACVNYVPVRVTLPAACTVSNLLRAVHEQQTRSMAFETIEYDDLVAKCTSWPADTEPGTGIHYVNIPDVFAGSGLPGVQSDHETYVFRLPHYHPRVVCSPLSKGTLELKLYVSDHLWEIRVKLIRLYICLGRSWCACWRTQRVLLSTL